jgi:hypothetical protein
MWWAGVRIDAGGRSSAVLAEDLQAGRGVGAAATNESRAGRVADIALTRRRRAGRGFPVGVVSAEIRRLRWLAQFRALLELVSLCAATQRRGSARWDVRARPPGPGRDHPAGLSGPPAHFASEP